MRRIAFALAMVATIVVTAGSLAGHQPGEMVSTASPNSDDAGPRSVRVQSLPLRMMWMVVVSEVSRTSLIRSFR